MTRTKKIKKIYNNSCDLIYLNKIIKLVKKPERIFFLKAKKDCIRGNHAHKVCSQLFISIHGSIKILVDNGKKIKTYNLKSSSFLKIKPLNWVKVSLKKNQILCVICDKPYSESEYIRDYKNFKKLINKV